MFPGWGMMIILLTLIIGLTLTAWRYTNKRAVESKGRMIVFVYIASLLVWLLLTSLIASRLIYVKRTPYFLMDIGTFVPFVITGCFLLIPTTRRVLREWIMSVKLKHLIWINILRLAAIGTIVKMLNGALPAHFIVPVGIPDFLFALSVPVMAWLVLRKKVIGKRGLVLWNVLGMVVFFPTLILIYLSVPGPIQVFFEGPNTFEVFRYPMALVPTFIAPLFILLHNAAIFKLLNTRENKSE